MPGLSFICDLKGRLTSKEPVIRRSLDALIHTGDYQAKVLLSNNLYFLGYSAYKEYPIVSFENEEFSIYLEGQIYGKDCSAIEADLGTLAKYIFSDQIDVTDRIGKCLLTIDGEFVVCICRKNSKQVAIMNDALGRLPLYYYSGGDGKLVVSRELRFVADLSDTMIFDRMAIAQYLLFGYPLGKRTLLENVFRLEPATLIKVDFGTSKVKIDTLRRFNFENKEHNNIETDQSVDSLVSLFCEACKNRAKRSDKIVLALSGGLDSRSVAAGLCKTGTPFSAATRLGFDKKETSEVKIAEELAQELNFDWKLFELEPPKGRDFLRLLRIKSGLNYLGMSFILLFFDKLKQVYGPDISYFTGDGGDKMLPDLSPSKRLKDVNALIGHIISQNHIFSLDDVVAITKIPRNSIIDELKNHVLSYPETAWNQKYVHFFICERGFKWLFEGEDRNRYFFWSTTPFYSVRFFDYAMNIPDSMKSGYKLYGEFLTKLSPQASAIDNVRWKAPIRSGRARLRLFAMNFYLNMPPNLRRIIKQVLKKAESEKYNPNVVSCLQEQVRNCESVRDYLSLDEVIKNCEKYNGQAIFNLFTIVSTIEQAICPTSTIQRFLESDFA